MVHRRPVYIYLFNVPSISSRHFNKIKRTSRLGRLLALSLEILFGIWLSDKNILMFSLYNRYIKHVTSRATTGP